MRSTITELPQIENLRILRWVNGGDGLGVVETGDDAGLVVFVPGSVPGDLVHVRLEKRKKRWARAQLLNIREPSPDRVTPECTIQAECGGCPWMVGKVETQRRALGEILLKETMKRFHMGEDEAGRLVKAPDPKSGPALGYRNRLRLAFRTDRKGDVTLGFRRGGSREIVSADTCVVAVSSLRDAMTEIRGAFKERPEQEGEVHLVAGEEGVSGWIEPKRGRGRPWGLRETTVVIGSARVPVEARMFVQGNAAIGSEIAAEIESVARAAGGAKAVEFFCGSGTFTVALLKAGYCVVGYDIVDACEAAFDRSTAPWGKATFYDCDLVRDGSFPIPPPPAPDLVLLDPPRAGATETIDWVALSSAKVVLMVSCDIATGLRDAQRLRESGFSCVSVTGYDLFPNTGHQEILIHLER